MEAQFFIVVFFTNCLIFVWLTCQNGAKNASLETRFMRNKFRSVQKNKDSGGIPLSSVSMLPGESENQKDHGK